nr:CD99 antigen-like protein 2 isoform X3 [Rattus norvegicus]
MELDGFDLEDALDDQNDLDGPKKPSTGEGGGWSDKDLEDILGGGGYKPDKNKGSAECSCSGAQSGSQRLPASPRAEQDAAATTPEVAAIRLGFLLKTGDEADHIHLLPQLWLFLYNQTLPAESEL